MDQDIIMNFRNMLLFGAIATTATCYPDLLSRFVKPLQKIRCWYLRCRESFRIRLLDRRENAFWEIDMTKFEP